MTIGAPQEVCPKSRLGNQNGNTPRVDPRGTSQAISLRRRSTLTKVAQGGGAHGRPHGETKGSRSGVSPCNVTMVGSRLTTASTR